MGAQTVHRRAVCLCLRFRGTMVLPLPPGVSRVTVPVPRRTDISWRAVLWRGLLCRCPSCGRGRTLAGYLTVAERCNVCGARFGHLRVDDAAAWLAITLVGAVVFPAIMIAEIGWQPPIAATIGVAVAATAVLVAVLLRLSKGVILAVLWRLDDGHGAGAASQ